MYAIKNQNFFAILEVCNFLLKMKKQRDSLDQKQTHRTNIKGDLKTDTKNSPNKNAQKVCHSLYGLIYEQSYGIRISFLIDKFLTFKVTAIRRIMSITDM